MKNKIKFFKLIKSNINIFSIYKTNKHIYFQIYSKDRKKVIVSSSSNEFFFKSLIIKKKLKFHCFKLIKMLLKNILIRSKNRNINKVIFNSRNYKFHGNIKKIFLYLKNKNFIYLNEKKKNNIC